MIHESSVLIALKVINQYGYVELSMTGSFPTLTLASAAKLKASCGVALSMYDTRERSRKKNEDN